MKYKELEELIKKHYKQPTICEHSASAFFNKLYSVDLNVTEKQARDFLDYSKAFKQIGTDSCVSCFNRHKHYTIMTSKLNVKTNRIPYGSSKGVKQNKKRSIKIRTVKTTQKPAFKKLKPVTVYECPHCKKMVSL